MKEQDFRIGNHVKFNGKIVVVCEINEEYICVVDKADNSDSVAIGEVEPIHITSAVLGRLGDGADGNTFCKKGIFPYRFNVNFWEGNYWIVSASNNKTSGRFYVSFLHELENIYYMCFGEELKYE